MGHSILKIEEIIIFADSAKRANNFRSFSRGKDFVKILYGEINWGSNRHSSISSWATHRSMSIDFSSQLSKALILTGENTRKAMSFVAFICNRCVLSSIQLAATFIPFKWRRGLRALTPRRLDETIFCSVSTLRRARSRYRQWAETTSI